MIVTIENKIQKTQMKIIRFSPPLNLLMKKIIYKTTDTLKKILNKNTVKSATFDKYRKHHKKIIVNKF